MAKVGNLSLFSGATVVQSRPKSYTVTVNLAVFAPSQDGGQKPWKGILALITCKFVLNAVNSERAIERKLSHIINPFTPVRATETYRFYSNARRFYSSMGNPTGVKGLNYGNFFFQVRENGYS